MHSGIPVSYTHLDQTHRRRTNPRARIGTLQGQYLPFQARRSHAAALAVARSGYALNHRIDAIAIALGVFHALQHHHADAFADGDTIGRFIERAAAATWGKRLRLGETHIAERALRGIHAAHDGHIALVVGEFARSQIDGCERRSTGGIHAEVHTTEVDFGPKRKLYQRAGVREYITIETFKKRIVWRVLVDGVYMLQETSPDGTLRSLVFPGLWLDVAAFWAEDGAKMLAALNACLASAEHQRFVERLAKAK